MTHDVAQDVDQRLGSIDVRSRFMVAVGAYLIAVLLLHPMHAGAQADRNCEDFATQLEAQLALNDSYPDDPNRLDADGDWIACENYFELSKEEEARIVPANLANGAAQSTPEPTPEPATEDPTPEPEPAPEPAPAPALAPAGASSRVDPPADLMAQVELCEGVTVSSRSIAAAGCPGVGTIVLRPPAGTPRMRSQVIIRPGAALRPAGGRVATAAQEAEPRASGKKRSGEERERPAKKRSRANRASPNNE